MRSDLSNEGTRRRRAFGRWLCALGAFVVGVPFGHAEVIERILAVVDARPVLLSEVGLVESLRGVDRAAALETAIDERLMFQEAARLPLASVTGAEEEEAYRSLTQRAPAAGAMPEAELRRLAHRQTTILKYVAARFRGQVQVGDDQIQSAYEREYAGGQDAPPLAAVREPLKQRIEARELDERIEAWVKELRAGAEIRYNP